MRGKAAEGRRTPKRWRVAEGLASREASWSAPVLWRFGMAGVALAPGGLRQNGAEAARKLFHLFDDEGFQSTVRIHCFSQQRSNLVSKTNSCCGTNIIKAQATFFIHEEQMWNSINPRIRFQFCYRQLFCCHSGTRVPGGFILPDVIIKSFLVRVAIDANHFKTLVVPFCPCCFYLRLPHALPRNIPNTTLPFICAKSTSRPSNAVNFSSIGFPLLSIR